MKLSNSQDKSYRIKKRQSLFETSELGKTISRINALPINIQVSMIIMINTFHLL